MRRFILTLLLLWGLMPLFAQNLTVASFEPLPQDVAARSNVVLDNNDNPCALLRVVVAVEGIEIRGNMGRRGEMINPRPSEYVAYLPAGTRTIYINSPGYMPLTYDIGYKMEGKMVYRLTLERPQLPVGPTKPEIKTQYVKILLPTAGSTVLIDGMPQPTSNGVFYGKFALGTHSYYISAPQHYPEEGEFTLAASGRADLTVALKPSYMPLNLRVSPSNATVIIDGKMLTLTGGLLTQKFEIGKHTYQIMASQYHSASGEFELTASGETNLNITLKPAFGFLQATSNPVGAEVRINGEKRGVTPCKLQLPSGQYSVQLVSDGYISHAQQVTITDGVTLPFSNTLTANFAQITLKAPYAHSEIWVNDQFKAKGEWSGRLDANTYLVETRTEGYETVSENVEVVAGVPRTVTLQKPNPIYGLLEITSEPFDATITLDGKVVGTTPWQSNEVLTGKHTLEIAKEGYNLYSQEFSLTKDQPITIEAVLDNRPAYKVGDYYNKNGKEGVVFWVDESGEHGKILSMTESGSKLQWSSDKNEQGRLIGADSRTDGAKNLTAVKRIPDWQSKYPAFKWCADLGEGWYLPAIVELKLFTLNDAVYDKVNRTLSLHGGKPLLNNYLHWCWSSTESSVESNEVFCAWLVRMNVGDTSYSSKNFYYYVRAVSAF